MEAFLPLARRPSARRAARRARHSPSCPCPGRESADRGDRSVLELSGPRACTALRAGCARNEHFADSRVSELQGEGKPLNTEQCGKRRAGAGEPEHRIAFGRAVDRGRQTQLQGSQDVMRERI